jgi:FAD synthetase
VHLISYGCSAFRYTSFGNIHNTVPNKLLRDGSDGYRPTYTLSDGSLERARRAEKAVKKYDPLN